MHTKTAKGIRLKVSPSKLLLTQLSWILIFSLFFFLLSIICLPLPEVEAVDPTLRLPHVYPLYPTLFDQLYGQQVLQLLEVDKLWTNKRQNQFKFNRVFNWKIQQSMVNTYKQVWQWLASKEKQRVDGKRSFWKFLQHFVASNLPTTQRNKHPQQD